MKSLVRVICLVIVYATRAHGQAPSDAEIRRILAERIDKYQQSIGIVVGVIEPQGRRIVSYGTFSKGSESANDSRPVSGDTVYEIGSITKVFTGLILADMVERGEVALSDPVAKYLPANVRMPVRKGKQITLLDLSTHRSGLPRMPSNYSKNGPDDPYAIYPEEKLYEFLSSYQLTRDIGSKFEYSNMGVALLGLALSRRAGMDWESLVRQRVLTPLGMSSTGFVLTPDQTARLTPGHTNLYWLSPAPSWNLSTFVGAGGLRSTATDMLTFLAANLGLIQTPLASSLSAMLKVRRDVEDGDKIGLGWFIRREQGTETVWHNGGTFGYKSFIAFDPKQRFGVVVLSNSGSGGNVNDIGRHIMNPRIALNTFGERRREEVRLDGALLDAYVGRYELPDKDVWDVRRQGDRLLVRTSATEEFEIFPSGNHRFFLKTADAEVTFEFDKDSQAGARGFALRQVWLAQPQRARRID